MGEEGIVARSADQRSAGPGEPCCVVCGRYGEYICDLTDDDVCSLECKASVIRKREGFTSQIAAEDPPAPLPRRKIFLPDECIRVRDETGAVGVPDKRLRKEQVAVGFEGFGLLPRIRDNLQDACYQSPTPVQVQSIPAALQGRDLLVSAATGSGKTAAYLLPIVDRCCRMRMQRSSRSGLCDRPLALVLTPTRELCGQVEEQAKMFGKGLPFKTALVVGGDALPQQVYRLKQGVELIVGTPGRLIDVLTKEPVAMDDICMLVLDEVDCMLEQGFREQVMQLVRALCQPQILLFSATIPPAIHKLSEALLKAPLLVSVGQPSMPSTSVMQTVIWVESNRKKKKLFEILNSSKHFTPPALVFVGSRMGAELLAESIQVVTGLKAAAVHGEKSTQERRKILDAFLSGDLPLLVATGVLGRGLDLLLVSQVIVFDMPHALEEYVHQIGRASRMSNPGSALVFINNDDKAVFKGLLDMLRMSKSPVPRELATSPYVHSTYAVSYKSRKRKM